ncbi:uncharacterized protein K452DRAFT_72421 [Aplosporella prunicola CBS 121167]|uniref:Uncharacterized protein n=1 Tax=Aplosporella prunicola CBS 121167 TaxID=1176127 RepID=A0A6A6BW28_9PEZI|nr:uncharacterized protein K452DRAFT_72421 [Aplosporella prunicola CBS 121167]KAF2146901.1 hypothetical protein K452DRAFT_72421 [Aplosporella prunicola CBS 121167]
MPGHAEQFSPTQSNTVPNRTGQDRTEPTTLTASATHTPIQNQNQAPTKPLALTRSPPNTFPRYPNPSALLPLPKTKEARGAVPDFDSNPATTTENGTAGRGTHARALKTVYEGERGEGRRKEDTKGKRKRKTTEARSQSD